MTDEQIKKHDRMAYSAYIAKLVSRWVNVVIIGVVILLWLSIMLPVWVIPTTYGLIVISAICKIFWFVWYKNLYTFYSTPIPKRTLLILKFALLITLLYAIVMGVVLYFAKESFIVSLIIFIAFIVVVIISYKKYIYIK